MKSEVPASIGNSTTVSAKNYKLIRNTVIGLVVVVVIYFTGSYGYAVSGEYTKDDKSHSFSQSGGTME